MVTYGPLGARELDSFGVVGAELGSCWWEMPVGARVLFVGCERKSC